MRETIPAHPLVLDIDGSVLPLEAGETRLHLAAWEEALRFGCSRRFLRDFQDFLTPRLPEAACVFTGSGDFHHLSLPLLRILAERKNLAPESLDVLVLDNHPDSMRYPFGVHCGSWAGHAAMLPFVRQVHVAGITSTDISAAHAWEMQFTPLARRKICFWSVGIRADWLRLPGRGGLARSFPSADALTEALAPSLRAAPLIYVSIDKDVFSPATAQTNWDQGVFEPEHAEALLAACPGAIAGADITGEVSAWRPRSLFKRTLMRLEGLPPVDENALPAWQGAHQTLNRRLLSALKKSM